MEQHTLTFHTIKLGKKIQKAISHQKFPFSLGSTPASALLLILQSGDITQIQIAKHLHLEPASIVSIIDELEKLKLVKRVHSKNDRRSYQITLTDVGINAAQIINEQTEKLDKFLRSKLSLSEFKVLFDVTEKLTAYLDQWEGGEHGSKSTEQSVASPKS